MNHEFVVPGFLANGIHCGIKENGYKDLGMIFSIQPASAAGVFTKNAFKAAPVLLDMERIQRGEGQAVIANSGVANAATGIEGLQDAREMSLMASRQLGIRDELVYVASTGVIGYRVPISKIRKGMPRLVTGLKEDGFSQAEEAIMTTDKRPKMSLAKGVIDGREITVCGLAKGAGMIEPHMATMLAFIMTDANIESGTLDKLFRSSVDRSFNAITVDGCMSTNDTALILANGQSGLKPLNGSRNIQIFKTMLDDVLSQLSFSMVQDGEGATKVIELRVEEAKSRMDARRIAYAVANSNLVKTAFYGGDPNWGRIIGAIGAVKETIPVNAVRVTLNHVVIFADGRGIDGHESELKEIMALPHIRVLIQMGMGKAHFQLLASDLTHEYVTINAHYHT
ncbi:MAG: bifunctional glutamate N-acetyltransferase/amino-acid acetyltransferase ArgJ [Deltaproteobacteria bacterium]|jgi:glutamate N-acetyltransferase/amino-acid N-acetyltransferase|nr:bifunctional glutamate N-acetyltransferase/amino-acid acetyltransferase ArgJ [Deltaproteobacteria bacterium]